MRQRGGLRGQLLAGRVGWRAIAGLAVALVVTAWLMWRGGVTLDGVALAPWTLTPSVPAGAVSTAASSNEGARKSEARTAAQLAADDPCGPDAAPALDEVVLGKEGRRLRAEVVAALKASADVNDQATAAILLSSHFMDEAPTRACGDDPACMQAFANRSSSRERKDAHAAVQSLALLAERSQSSYVYQLALLGCRDLGKGDTGAQDACNGLSLERWATIDPKHTAPWMAIAERARLRDDAAVLDNALYQAAQAEHSRGISSELMRRVLAHVPSDGVHRDLQSEISIRAFGVAMLDIMGPGYSTAMGVCREVAQPDSNRRQTCRMLGEHWLAQSDSILQSRMALALIKQSGMGPQPSDREQDEADALTYALSLAVLWQGAEVSPANPICGMIVAGHRHFAEVAKSSEIEAARKVLAAYMQRTGKSVADVAREFRARGAK